MKVKLYQTRQQLKRVRAWVALVALALGGTLSGCTTTQKVEVQKTEVPRGFLGTDYSRLTPGDENQASLRYINPTVQWTKYKKLMLEPVTFWGSDTTKISAADQEMLCNYFYQTLQEQLGSKFTLVTQAGPDVMRLQVALLDAEAATPGLRSISMVIPQARTLNTLKYAATGTYAFVGGAEAEAKLTDSVNGEILGEWVDKRIGGGSLETAAQWQWGDAENAIKYWATTATERLSAWTSGAAKPS